MHGGRSPGSIEGRSLNPTDPTRYVSEYAPLTTVAWLLFVVAASVVRRRVRDKPIWPTIPQDFRFAEKFASGYSCDNFVRRLGGARNCLLVIVTDQAIAVTPIFPFNLMFLPEVWGLEHLVPLDRITAVVPTTHWYGNRVELEFDSDDGGRKRFALILRMQSAFLAALQDTHRVGPLTSVVAGHER